LIPNLSIDLLFASAACAQILADLLIKSTAVLLAASVACRLLRKFSASVRHRIWLLAVSAILVIPITGSFVPSLEVPLFKRDMLLSTTATVSENSTDSHPTPSSTESAVLNPTKMELSDKAGSHVTNGNLTVGNLSNAEMASGHQEIPLTLLIASVWLAGVSIILLSLLANFTIAHKILRSASPAGLFLKRTGLRLANQIGIRRRVRLSISASAMAPFTYGISKPVIILRNDESSRQPEAVEAVLLHELAHVKRHDVLTQTLAQIACVFFWFNPLVWMAARRMRIERELACDDFVLNCGARPSEYAQQLLELAAAGRPSNRPFWATAAMARRNHFKERIMSILSPITNRRGAGRVMSIAIALSAILIALPIAAMQFWSVEPTRAEEPPAALASIIRSAVNQEEILPNDKDLFERSRHYYFKLISELPIAFVEGRFLGKTIPFKQQGDAWMGLSAIPLDTPAGSYTIEFETRYKDGTTKKNSKTIRIGPKKVESDRGLILKDVDQKKKAYLYFSKLGEMEKLDELFSESSETPLWDWPFIMPAEGRVSLRFNGIIILVEDKRYAHNGVNLAMPAGTPIKAGSTGRIVLVEENEVRGETVVIDHGGGVFTGYRYLAEIKVEEGQLVKQGEIIGLNGSTGISTGPHLHWFLNINGVYCDPMKLSEQP